MARRSDRGRRPFGDGEAAPPDTTVTIDTGELPPRPGGAGELAGQPGTRPPEAARGGVEPRAGPRTPRSLRRVGHIQHASPAGYQRLFGPDHPQVAKEHHVLGVTYSKMGQSQDALSHLQTAVAQYERLLGPEDPQLARALGGLGLVLMQLDRRDEAVSALRRSLTIDEKVLGADHPGMANSLRMLGGTLADLGRDRGAEAHLERAVAIRQRAQGASHPEVGAELAVLGEARLRGGRYRAAWAALDRARAILEEDGGSGDLHLVYGLLARVRLAERRHRDALGLLRQSAAAYQRTGGDLGEHGQTLLLLATTELALGQVAAGEGTFARLVELWQREPAAAPVAKRAAARLAMAKATWARPADRRRRARELAQGGLDELAADPAGDHVAQRAEIVPR